MVFRFVLIVLFVFNFSVGAATPKRFGAVDIDSSQLSVSEKDAILKTIREKVSRWKIWQVLSKEEITQQLVQPNSRKVEFDKLVTESKINGEKLSEELQAAVALYQQSRFFEALKSFEDLTNSVRSAPFNISADFTRDLFQIYSASAFFEDRQDEAKAIFRSLKILDSSWKLNPDKFPPPLVESFESVLPEEEELNWKFQSDQKDFSASFWGFSLPVREDGKLSIKLPVKDFYLKKAPLVLTKEGYFPNIIWIDSLPEKVQWISLAEKTRSTRTLFGPVGSLTANPELKWFIAQLQLSVLILIAAEKKGDRWLLQGQWYEGSTGHSSEVREVRATDPLLGAEGLLDVMINDIATDGRIIDPRGNSRTEPSRISESGNQFYKTWWFWTLAGVGLAGVGLGTYAILSSSDSLKFQVKAAP